jgi:hypothetical protein
MFRNLSRRTFLRGAGVALALPWLEAMGPSALAATAMGPLPKRRMLCIRYPLSLHPEYFFPTETGRNYALSPYLEVLKDFRDDFTVFSGMSHPGQGSGGGHVAEPVFLTGVPVSPDAPNFRNSISLDQMIAEKIGLETRLPYVSLASNLSHTRSGATIPGMGSPSQIFAKMFLEGSPQEVQLQKHRLRQGQSIMDVVRGQARELESRIGHGDRGKLDEYFDSVRDVEKRLGTAQEWAKKPKPIVKVAPPKDAPGNGSATTRLYYDLAHLAFVTDSTRLITMETIHWTVPPLEGVTFDHHNLSHNGKDPEKIRQLRIVDLDAMTALRDFLAKLKNSQEEGQSLLDRTLVLAGSQMHSGGHVTTNLPVFLAGGGFKHGQHLAFDPINNVALSNLFVMMLRQFGLDVKSFGSSTGVVPGLDVVS